MLLPKLTLTVMNSVILVGAIHSTKIPTGPTGKKGVPVFSKLFRLDQTDPLRFGPKFPEILVEWIALSDRS